ncbi:response regulator [Oculatella sp. LEGE 06141]|uniref:response regulator n=1 Tax=Oculatella sp. LEGE 06141 TaxID=1828648 RepID=UPI0018826C1D|nr:response regulator [Oculatella sp. LEGE 06141]MBE9182149.1 response regulator [Oculatella sp. LEGE 06141]
MITAHDSPKDSPSRQLGLRSQIQFTGRLNVQASNQQWGLYLYMGRLIWATGGPHPYRRWHRYITQYCPQVNVSTLPYQETDGSQCWNYSTLAVLAERQQITGEQAVAVVRSTVAEVLFDIIQQEETQPVTFQCNPQDLLERSLTLINTEHTLQEIQRLWNTWAGLGLVDHSPNLAPVLRRPEQLQQQTSEKAYATLVSLVDGKRTFRDLAALMQQDLLLVTRMLLPFFRKGLIGLTKIPDLPPPLLATAPVASAGLSAPSALGRPVLATGSLVACIDDSKRECQAMEQILTQAGYRFVGIQDSIQALPTLLEQKPGLIFLDLVMPIANGYEICAQLRRVSLFKETPIVILTGNDGIIDRVRAKLVGSSGFLAKPVDAEKVLAIARKYLPSRRVGHGE